MSRPPLFRDLTLAEAEAAARREEKLLLVDVMGSWCPPCRMMDATTWRDARVEAWVAEKAVAIQIDSQDESVRDFSIEGVPTLLVFRGGALHDRVTGALPAATLLDWLETAARGEKYVWPEPEVRDVEPDDMHGRRRNAAILAEQGKVDEAAAELAWLWQNMLKVSPSWLGVRHSYLIDDIEKLLEKAPSVAGLFRDIRDREEARLPDGDAFKDWVDLNHALGEDDRTLAWFDRVEGDFPPNVSVQGHPRLLELLVGAGRWAELGRLLEPTSALGAELHLIAWLEKEAGEPSDPGMLDFARRRLRDQAAVFVKALRAAERHDEAAAVIERARQEDPSPEMAAALAATDG